ncbi:MAG: signal peptide peptidase SppA [Methanobrevibacter wolinii]|uniref:signal peptide peptidase SppA n=1 Tax=Methanobrevibacter wolinii TaxID=190977 RepID=UPI000694A62C|nr:signal peptide peptidase SppA [Methanobrevibacter wolinii]
MDDKAKYFGYGILGGFLIIFIIIILFSVIGSTGLFGSTSVAVIPIYGEISYGNNGTNQVITPDEFQKAITEADNDPSVGAIVLDINSPGGSTVASNEMMEMVKNTSKPTVAWIGESGTSGAYLVASACDKIITTNSSMIGNIGAIITLTDLSKYYNNTGINTYSIKSGEYKDIGADYRNLSPNETKMLQKIVDHDADNFKIEIAKNRKLSKSYIDNISNGEIYDGSEAKDKKLVDKIGSKKDAIEYGRKMGNLSSNYEVKTMNTNQNIILGIGNYNKLPNINFKTLLVNSQ